MIDCKCKQCNKSFRAKKAAKRQFCSRFCAYEYRKIRYVGSKNPNWRGGAPNCLSCSGKLSAGEYPKRGTLYCQQCYIKTLKGVTHPNWKGGIRGLPGYGAVYRHKYRALKKSAVGTFTIQEWSELKKKYNFMCLCCKKLEPEVKLEADHIVPISKGGANNISNIQPLCRGCNARKSAKTIDYTLGEFGY